MLALPTLPRHLHEQAAAELHQAERSRTQVRQLTLRHPEMTVADAYEVQAAWLRLKLAEGHTIAGRKVGLTSRAMRDALGIDDSDLGTLFDDMLHVDGAVIPFARYIEPKVEVELAFVLKEPLSGPNVNFLDVLRATESIVPAIEILDARMHRIDPDTKRQRTVIDTISDNAANAGFLIGGRPFKPDAADLRWVSALCLRNGEVIETGSGAGVLNHPANGIAWLVNALHKQGQRLDAGQIHLSGSFIRPVAVRKGDTIHADFGPFGSVSCCFG
jgi:2-oxo-hept-3-ene-1,7-dioate hydratase